MRICCNKLECAFFFFPSPPTNVEPGTIPSLKNFFPLFPPYSLEMCMHIQSIVNAPRLFFLLTKSSSMRLIVPTFM